MIHAALDELVTVISAAGCHTAAEAVSVLRSKGGISSEIDRQIRVVAASLDASARTRHRSKVLERSLERQVPEMRYVVQSTLARVLFTEPTMPVGWNKAGTGARGALGLGLHPEVKIAPTQIPWIGWADAIRVANDSCEIIDYKSGVASSTHFDQLRIYALLWARDRTLNPSARLADTLTLVYSGTVESIPGPSQEELLKLEDSLRARVQEATNELRGSPPSAHVDPDTCRYCDVKQLCAAYWDPAGQELLRETIVPIERSLQAVVVRSRADRVWELTIEADAYIPAGTSVIGMTDGEANVNDNDRVRLVDVRVSDDGEGRFTIALGPRSEIFVLP